MWLNAWFSAFAADQVLVLQPALDERVRFTTARPLDVLVADAADLTIERLPKPEFGLLPCPSSGPCLLQQVTPGELITIAGHFGVREASVTLREPPPPTPLQHGATTRLQPLLSPSDPYAAATLHLDAPAEVTLTWRDAHEGAEHRGVHLLALGVYGPRGEERPFSLEMLTIPDPDRATWSLPAGSWAVRVAGEGPHSRAACAISSPAWCDPPPDDRPFPVDVTTTIARADVAPLGPLPPPPKRAAVLDVGVHVLPVAPAKPPSGVQVPLTPDTWVIATWSPASTVLNYAIEAEGNGWYGGCTSPCRQGVAAHGTLTLSTPDVDEPAPPIMITIERVTD